MSHKNFVNFHILISHSPSCLNRDDMNMQKSATFGGVRRVRISSQSLKRAMRKSDYYEAHLGQTSDRTRELGKIKTKYVEALKERFSEAQVIQAIEWISGKEGLVDDTRADAVAPWAVEEVASLCQKIVDAGEDADSKKLQKQIEKEAKFFRAAASSALDIALSGRMATSGLMTSIDGALAVAHALTTHVVDADIDWFTAVDDLVVDEGDVGAGHLNTQEFSSGVFYRYASLNLRQLQENLGNVSREQALSIAKHVLHMLSTIVPSAKQQSFAAHNPADFALVSFSDLPVSLANAFENPIKAKAGFLSPSIDQLKSYWQDIHQAYGLDEEVAAFQFGGAEHPKGLKDFKVLSELENWIAGDGESAS